MIKDQAFRDSLDAEAESRDMWIENSEFDPTDLMICSWVELE